MSTRRNLGRIHIWLGWLIGIPLLIWTATGLWMVARPIDEVRGVQLKAEPPVLATNATPIDLRKEKAAWQIAFADGANVYVDADTGSLLAIRSGQWRIFDFMWGLHIMDLQTRENTSHPILILFAIMAFIGTAFGLILLPLSARRKRRRQ